LTIADYKRINLQVDTIAILLTHIKMDIYIRYKMSVKINFKAILLTINLYFWQVWTLCTIMAIFSNPQSIKLHYKQTISIWLTRKCATNKINRALAETKTQNSVAHMSATIAKFKNKISSEILIKSTYNQKARV
jgi:hypothetical protein